MNWHNILGGKPRTCARRHEIEEGQKFYALTAADIRGKSAIGRVLVDHDCRLESGEGSGIVPSWALAASRNRRVVMSRLINPVVNLDFYQISDRGKKLPPGTEEFTSFLQSYIARWAGRAGILQA